MDRAEVSPASNVNGDSERYNCKGMGWVKIIIEYFSGTSKLSIKKIARD